MKTKMMSWGYRDGFEVQYKPEKLDREPADNNFIRGLSTIYYNVERQTNKYPKERDCEVISDKEAAQRILDGVRQAVMEEIQRNILFYNQVEQDFLKMKFDQKGNLVKNHPYRTKKPYKGKIRHISDLKF